MSYIGRDLQLADISKIDNIGGSFNGSTVTFPLKSGGTALNPANAAQCLISVGGVIQEAFVDYSVSTGSITFTAAPATGESFFGIVLGRGYNVGTAATTASAVTFTATGTIVSTNVQSAIAELDGDVSSLSTTVGTKLSGTNPTMTGAVTISGTGSRIVGDLTNATPSSRLLFQTSTSNSATYVGLLPSGTSTTSAYSAFNTASPDVTAGVVSFGITNAVSYIDSGKIGTGTTLPFALQFAGTERMRWSVAGGYSVGTTADPGVGAIYATGQITANYSDGRLKDIKGTIQNALDKVKSLSGIVYTNNALAAQFGYDTQEEQVGLIAQEVQAVLPQVVKAAPFDLDENNSSKSGQNYQTVQYERIVPLLVEAIKELSAEVDRLNTRLKGLVE